MPERYQGAIGQILQGILWVARTGASWREVPTDFGPWETIHSRYRRWRKQGLWPRIIAALHPLPTPRDTG
jgi:transposase